MVVKEVGIMERKREAKIGYEVPGSRKRNVPMESRKWRRRKA